MVRLRLLPVLLAVIALVAGCSSSTSSQSSGSTATSSAPAATAATAQRKPIPATAPLTVGQPFDLKGSFANHSAVAAANWADPFAFMDGGRIYTYATNTNGANIPVADTDGTTYVYRGDAMPKLASWTAPGAVWAPSVYRRADGTYVMFYDSAYGMTTKQCVGVATSSSPTGPFVDSAKAPLVCPVDLGGAIDASMLMVDGTPHLLYKSDGNCCDMPTSIWSVPLADDLLSTVGQPTELITNDQTWEGDVVEAPTMVRVGDRFLLFYAGNDWGTKNYAIGYAECASITGPCTKPRQTAWGPSMAGFQGPGGAAFLTTTNDVDLGTLAVGSEAVMVFHAWPQGKVDPAAGERELFVSIVEFGASGPSFVKVS